jgi:hypothetical protein
MRRLATWSVFLLVGAVAVIAIVAAVVNNDSSSRSSGAGTKSTPDVSLCDSKQLELSIRASGFAGHVAALRASGTGPCDVGELHVTATVVDRNGQGVSTTVAPPQEFSGEIHPGEELVETFDYTMRCRQKEKGPFSATVIAEGEIGSVRATSPVAFRRDPFETSPCKRT